MITKTYIFGILTLLLSTLPGCEEAGPKAPVWNMGASFGGKSEDMADAMALDAEGNIYITGSFQSAELSLGEHTFYNQSETRGNDYFVAKLDANGKVIWADAWGGRLSEGGRSLAVDDKGNVYVSGVYMSDSLTVGETILTKRDSGQNTDLFVAKYNTQGTLQWIWGAGSEGNDSGSYIQLNGEGNLLLAGSFQSIAINLQGQGLVNKADNSRSDIMLAEISPEGEVLWAKSYGGANDEIVYGMGQAENGDVYLTGYFSEVLEAEKVKAYSHGAEDIFILKLDATGTPLWATAAGGHKTDYASGLAVGPDGGVVIAGSIESEKASFDELLIKNEHSDSPYDLGWNFDLFLAKYSADGKAQWVQSGHGIQQDYARSVAINKQGDIYFTGFFLSSWVNLGGDTLNNTALISTQETIVAKYNAQGQHQWATHAKCQGNDQGNIIKLDPDGNPIVLGRFAYNMTVGNDSLTCKGGWDIYLARIVEE